MTVAGAITVSALGHPAPVAAGGEADWVHPALGETWHGTVTGVRGRTTGVRWHSYTPRGGGRRKPMRHATRVPAHALTPGRRRVAVKTLVAWQVKGLFDEALHPRDRGGKFTHAGQDTGGSAARHWDRAAHGSHYVAIPAGTTADGVKDLASKGRSDGTGTAGDPIDVQGDLDKAARLLADGKHVRLNQPSELATLVGKVSQLAAEHERTGKITHWDFGKLSVAGTNLFTGQHRGIPRIQMPQLSGRPLPGTPAEKLKEANGKANLGDHLPAKLAADGIQVHDTTVPMSRLRATQMDLDGAAIAGMVDALRSGDPGLQAKLRQPLYVTRDQYVIDGHHRWATEMVLDSEDGILGNDTPAPVRVIDMDIGAAIPYIRDYTTAMGLPAKALTEHKALTGGVMSAPATKALFAEARHPRGHDGKFIEIGGDVQLPGGMHGRVTGMRGNQVIVAAADGTHRVLPAGQLTSAAGQQHGFHAMHAPAPLSDEDYAAHRQTVESKINTELKAGRTTDRMHTIGGNGETYTPERAAMHKQIVDDIMARHEHVPTEGKAIMAGGPGGAGKTTVLKGHAGVDTSKYIALNPDDVKEEMAKRGMVPHVPGLSPMEASTLIHDESSRVTNMLAKAAYAKKKNVIWDVSMSSPKSTQRRIDELHHAGYSRPHGIYVDIPTETSVQRAISRHRAGLEDYRAGQGHGGRYMPPSVIRETAGSGPMSNNRASFNAVRHHFGHWDVYDNSVHGRAPQHIEGSHR